MTRPGQQVAEKAPEQTSDGVRTICDWLRAQGRDRGDQAALHQPEGTRTNRTYRTYSWAEYAQAMDEIAAGLHSLGVRKGDAVALDSESRAELYLFDLGAMACGAVSAALYPTTPPKGKRELLERCRVRVLACESAVSLSRLARAEVETRVLLSGEAAGALTLDELRRRGRQAMEDDLGLLGRLAESIAAEDAAILYLTSGATGEPKIVIVSHGAIMANTRAAVQLIPIRPDDTGFAFLPSAHIAQRLVAELMPIAARVPVWFASSLETVAEEIGGAKPTAMVAPPQVWERIRRRVEETIRREPAWKRRFLETAISVGMRRSRLEQQGARIPLWMKAAGSVFERLVYRPMRDRVGGRLRLAISGAAPLAEDLAHFWAGLGLRITEGYGITEGGVLTFNSPGRERFGSVGRFLPGVEARLADDGELLVRSPFTFSGYFEDPEATAQVLKEQWLHTGDIARIDDDGLVYITGRKKEIIVSSSGKNIFPTRIESLFRSYPLISNVFLVGDNRPHLAALVTINPMVARTVPGMENLRDTPQTRLTEVDVLQKEIARIVREVNRSLASAEQIKRFTVLPRDFTVEKGEVTPTMKLRRPVILEAFKDEIAALYAGE